ncbi:MAG TPA: glycosyltransferase family 4 protein [Syntrophales bacterium]|nr:glycosyltransferase family 4 protein [Syntrophales bacterium]
MRIAMLSPVSWRTPPRHYGPWELIVSLLTEGLAARGIDVTLFATSDSVTTAHLEGICPAPCEEDKRLDPKVWECLHISHLMEMASQFDLIHNHYDFLPLTYSRLISTPMLTTIHGFSSPAILPAYRRYNGYVGYVSISIADRASDLDYIANVYHGIAVEEFPYADRPGDYLLFFGRIHADKGVREAIEAARIFGMPLLIAGIVQDRKYFHEKIEPELDGRNVIYIGSVGPERRGALLSGAYALLHLIGFNEPFGLSLIEAMACGTPVVAHPRGSIPELVDHGVTGFHVTGMKDTLQALDRVGSLDRSLCRRTVEERFHRDRMVRDYIDVYARILSGALNDGEGRREIRNRRELLAHTEGHGAVEKF